MKKAFTMIELIFVIIVIGVLSAIAIPKIWGNKTDAYVTNLKSDIGVIRTAIENSARSDFIANLDEDDGSNGGYLDSANFAQYFENTLKNQLTTKTWTYAKDDKYKVKVQGIDELTFFYISSEEVKNKSTNAKVKNIYSVGSFVCIEPEKLCETIDK